MGHMDYYEKYIKRLKSIGNNVGEAYHNNTINFIEKTFNASSTYRVMDIESNNPKYSHIKKMDGRVVEVERLGTLREIILRPTKNLEIGMYAKIDDEWFLLIDKYGGTGSTAIKMLAIKINQQLRWYDEDGVLREFKCVASATDLGSKARQSKNEIEWNKYDVRLPVGQLFVSVEKNEYTEKIGLNHRFIFGRNVYEVTGIDDITTTNNEGYGIIQFTVKITTKSSKDDFEKQIAHNDYQVNTSESESNGISLATSDANEEEKDKGGRLW